MELYINSTWTERYGNAYVAEAIACSENGNHATVYAMGITADEADNKLMGPAPQAPAERPPPRLAGLGSYQFHCGAPLLYPSPEEDLKGLGLFGPTRP